MPAGEGARLVRAELSRWHVLYVQAPRTSVPRPSHPIPVFELASTTTSCSAAAAAASSSTSCCTDCTSAMLGGRSAFHHGPAPRKERRAGRALFSLQWDTGEAGERSSGRRAGPRKAAAPALRWAATPLGSATSTLHVRGGRERTWGPSGARWSGGETSAVRERRPIADRLRRWGRGPLRRTGLRSAELLARQPGAAPCGSGFEDRREGACSAQGA